MGDALDDALRLLAEHRRRRWKLTPERELEEERLQEERRRAAWMDVPEWRTFWDEATRDFKVPEGWPEGAEQNDGAGDRELSDEPSRSTFMRDLLEGRGRT